MQKEKKMSRFNIFFGVMLFFGTLMLMHFACAAIEYQGEGSLEKIKDRVEETNMLLIELNKTIRTMQQENKLNTQSIVELLNLNTKTISEALKFNAEVLNRLSDQISSDREYSESLFDKAWDWEYHQS